MLLLIDDDEKNFVLASSGHLPRRVLVKALSAILSVLSCSPPCCGHTRSQQKQVLLLTLDDSDRDDRQRMKVIELDFPEKDLNYIVFKELPSEGGATMGGRSKSLLAEEDPSVSPFLDDILR